MIKKTYVCNSCNHNFYKKEKLGQPSNENCPNCYSKDINRSYNSISIIEDSLNENQINIGFNILNK